MDYSFERSIWTMDLFCKDLEWLVRDFHSGQKRSFMVMVILEVVANATQTCIFHLRTLSRVVTLQHLKNLKSKDLYLKLKTNHFSIKFMFKTGVKNWVRDSITFFKNVASLKKLFDLKTSQHFCTKGLRIFGLGNLPIEKGVCQRMKLMTLKIMFCS